MNRRTFLQAAFSLIPAPLLARLPFPQALPVVDTPKPMIADIIEQYGTQPNTRVDFAPIDDGVSFTSTGMPVTIYAHGETILNANRRAQFDFTVDGIRQRQELDVVFLDDTDDKPQEFALMWSIMPSAGTHTYGIVQRVSNGTATTNARLHVSEVW
jgi:hypothetical protein